MYRKLGYRLSLLTICTFTIFFTETIIADGKLLVCLTIPIINFLNDCFQDTQQYTSEYWGGTS